MQVYTYLLAYVVRGHALSALVDSRGDPWFRLGVFRKIRLTIASPQLELTYACVSRLGGIEAAISSRSV
jgi:hypothetical protein